MIPSLFIFALTFLVFQVNIKGQSQETAPNTYILFLKNKEYSSFNLNKPTEFLSQKAIDRRMGQNIAIDSSDLPVSSYYIDSLKKLDIQIHNASRWFNSVTFKTGNAEIINTLNNINFVQSVKKTKPALVKLQVSESAHTEAATYDSTAYGYSYKQIHIHNGDYLHNNGLKGEDMLIAIIDAGFSNYKSMTGFGKIRSENRIKSIRDFVAHDGEVNQDHYHGALVFSIIGGEVNNEFIGTAPRSDFLLLRSEDATDDFMGLQSEYLVEEDNWISAAEYADSLGTDVINTSLGYSTFNNQEQDHTYNDMNGTTTRISLAADLATKKGMIVVVSAGNEGSGLWHYISAPADAKNVLTVGAIDTDLFRAAFSSVGPSADNRIKPDVMAIGQGTFFQNLDNSISSGNGTSFSAPVISGLTACLWQGAKTKTNLEIIDAIRKSSDNYLSPNNNYGYGIPDFKKALLMLNPFFESKGQILVFPNPFTSNLTIKHKPLKSTSVTIEIFNTTGKKLWSHQYQIQANSEGEISLNEVGSLPRGILFIRVISGENAFTATAVKL